MVTVARQRAFDFIIPSVCTSDIIGDSAGSFNVTFFQDDLV